MQHTEPATASRLLSLPLEIKADDESGTFEGYGAVFGNKDRDGDIVARGAFSDSLKAGMPALLWQHDQKAPIGRFDEVREDDKGLYVKGKLAMHGRGLEAYELLKMGALNGLSIGFVTKEASRDPATSTRTISKADLMEISLVTFPANELARVNSVKAAKDIDRLGNPASDTRSFERMLCENGFSRSRAKAITAKGFKAVDLGHDESAEIAGMVQELEKRKTALEGKGAVFDLFLNLVQTARTPINRVGLVPGEKATLKIAPVKLGRVSFAIEAPNFISFTCQISYYDFNYKRPKRQTETLFSHQDGERLSFSVNRGAPPKFNPLKPNDWKEQFPKKLVLDSTEATIIYHKFGSDILDKLPQRPAKFQIRVG